MNPEILTMFKVLMLVLTWKVGGREETGRGGQNFWPIERQYEGLFAFALTYQQRAMSRNYMP